jgi:hypothetical protein
MAYIVFDVYNGVVKLTDRAFLHHARSLDSSSPPFITASKELTLIID